MSTPLVEEIKEDDRITPKEAAEILGVTIKTLSTWRHSKKYIKKLPYYKPYGRVFYKESEVREFKNSGKVGG